jgi:hypothetical protein
MSSDCPVVLKFSSFFTLSGAGAGAGAGAGDVSWAWAGRHKAALVAMRAVDTIAAEKRILFPLLLVEQIVLFSP